MKSKNDDVVGMENHFEEENRIVAERKEKLKKIKEKLWRTVSKQTQTFCKSKNNY